jgi:uncharacterized protein (TIGR02145 family)
VSVLFVGCCKQNEVKKVVEIKPTEVTDIDGNVYKIISIGEQEWTASNLNVEHYRNGDIIPQVKDKNEWTKLKTGAWCYYDNKPNNGTIYGKLYNWYAVTDSRGLAPKGWHIPTETEWDKLGDYYGSGKAGGKLKSTTLWEVDDNPYEKGGTNETGFTALPGGYRSDYDGKLSEAGKFGSIGKSSKFWTSTRVSIQVGDSDYSIYFYIDYDNNSLYDASQTARRGLQFVV